VAKKEPMNLIQFQKAFLTEEACHNHLMKMKWPEGFRCPKCQHDKAYEITTRKLPLFECVRCSHQTTVIAGTIFEKTRTDLVKWFWAIFLIAHDKCVFRKVLATDSEKSWASIPESLSQRFRKVLGTHSGKF
jgi:Zn ribbon nucleic-acid-binding protein